MTKLIFENDLGMTHEFDPDEDYLLWPAGVKETLGHLRFADRLVLESLCWDIIHALNTEERS